MEQAEISALTIAKRLASCKQSTRSRAVHLLCSWLPNQSTAPIASSLSHSELIKLWKGLFFCVWHSDKLPNQVELINRLSTLLSSLCPQLACLYLETFLITIRREWSGIDFLRLDKFYLLIRRFLRHVFVFLKNNSWNLDLTSRIIGILSKGSLLSDDNLPAAGVNYHIAEIFLDEIVQFLPLSKEALDISLNPFISVVQTTTDKVLMNKIKISIFDRLAMSASNLIKNSDAGNDVEKFGKIALSMGFSKRFFELASAAETQQINRKFMFSMHDAYQKLDKEFEKSSLDISSVLLNNDSQVPGSVYLIETTDGLTIGSCNDINEEPAVGSITKKRKKGKKEIDESVGDSKSKKRNKKYLSSSIENNGIASESNDINEEPDIGSITQKRKKEKKSIDESIGDSKSKKRNKKLLNSSIENIGIGSEKMIKSKKQEKNLADMSSQSINADLVIRNFEVMDHNNNGDLHSSDIISFDDSSLSNLQKQFELVAAESGMTTCSNAKVPKKRKWKKNNDFKLAFSNTENFSGGSQSGKSAKKVSFSMKKNLVWKPQNPLPPQNLRLPPSVTPRGSALKKGLSPGPIRVSQSTAKKMKKRGSSSPLKKTRKILIAASPAVKHLRLFHGLSA